MGRGILTLGALTLSEEMVAQGDGEKQIYIGEYGFSHADTWMKAVPDATRADWLSAPMV